MVNKQKIYSEHLDLSNWLAPLNMSFAKCKLSLFHAVHQLNREFYLLWGVNPSYQECLWKKQTTNSAVPTAEFVVVAVAQVVEAGRAEPVARVATAHPAMK